MSEVTMTFDGRDLSNLITINDIRRDIGNETKIDTSNGPRFGTNVVSVNDGPKYIEVDFSIYTSYRNQLKHELSGIFNSEKDVRITFSDEPDKYYLGRKIGKIPMQEKNTIRSFGTVTFIIPDGVAHST